jgi:RHS repeat-associated protein
VDEDADGDGIPVVNNLRFPGQYFDEETGLHYNYHRDYDPATGRYLEADPMGIQRGMDHLYLYAFGSPIRFVDRGGLDPGDVFDSLPAAILDALDYAHKQALSTEREYGGWISWTWVKPFLSCKSSEA